MLDALRPTRTLPVCIILGLLFLIPTYIYGAIPPTLTAINPGNGSLGQTVTVTFTGTGFAAGGAFINVGGTGVGVAGVNVINDTTMTATFLVATGAQLNGHVVSVTTAGGNSAGLTFNVLGAPTLTSIVPNVGFVGSTTNYTFNGTNMAVGATVVTFPGTNGTGITINSITAANPNIATTRTVSLTIAPDAVPGPRSVLVSTAAGTSSPLTFTVTDSAGYTISTVAGTAGFVEGGVATAQSLPTPNDVARSICTIFPSNLFGTSIVRSDEPSLTTTISNASAG